MSIESLAIALHHSRSAGTAKLVLIGIANHDGDGGAWPAVSTLAKYAGVHRSNVQRALAKLEQLGEIRRIRQQGGDHSTADHMRPNLYRFLLACPADCDHTKNHRTPKSAALFDIAQPNSNLSIRAAIALPDSATATPGGRDAATRTIPLTQPTLKGKNSSNRARVCAGGHSMIDDRHCAFGCMPAELVNA